VGDKAPPLKTDQTEGKGSGPKKRSLGGKWSKAKKRVTGGTLLGQPSKQMLPIGTAEKKPLTKKKKKQRRIRGRRRAGSVWVKSCFTTGNKKK